MKTVKYIFVVLAACMLLGTSCKKDFYSKVNTNVNTPPTIVPYVLLSSVEGALGYTVGSTHCFYTSLLTQQTEGVSRQAAAYYQYIFTAQDFDDPWSNWYTSVMENDKTLMDLADSLGDTHYSGISRIIMAYSLQQVVDAWGSTPFTQAFKGLGLANLYPTYDNDAAIYASIAKLVDDGIVSLSTTSKDPHSPGAEDVIFGANAGKWIKFGHAIKARLYIHQSKGNAAIASQALAEVALSFASNGDNAQYIFGPSETNANPRYQYNENRADMSFTTSTLANMMIGNTDPRVNSLFDTTYSDVNGVGLAGYYGNPDAAVEFITYEELQFIAAEATLRTTGNFATAQTYFTAGIQASMDKFGIAVDSTYLADHGVLPTTSVANALTAVGYESWVTNYLNPEAFTTWRRTSAPALSPIAGSNIPRRFIYPQSEYSYNAANVNSMGNITLYSPRLFWDN